MTASFKTLREAVVLWNLVYENTPEWPKRTLTKDADCNLTTVDCRHIVFLRRLLAAADSHATSMLHQAVMALAAKFNLNGLTFTRTAFSFMKPINQLNLSFRPVIWRVKSWLLLTTSWSGKISMTMCGRKLSCKLTWSENRHTELLSTLH